jgi:hypothetical protein
LVVVGDDHDTAEFAVATIRRWWDKVGSLAYPKARRLLITADAGGSDGYRVRAWKIGLGTLAARAGLTITVCQLGIPDTRLRFVSPATSGRLPR